MQLNLAGVSGAGSFRRVTGAEMVAGVSGAGSFRRFPLKFAKNGKNGVAVRKKWIFSGEASRDFRGAMRVGLLGGCNPRQGGSYPS